jgi:toxin-antitoxin system PIN domain toxin
VSRALLDVNVLLALLDSDHADHHRARDWAADELDDGWASCAITENGFVRILSQPRYPSPVSPSQATALLSSACHAGDHAFWPCALSILDPQHLEHTRIHSGRHLTDAYLLALAVAHHGRLVTFDRSIPVSAVPGATAAHLTVL